MKMEENVVKFSFIVYTPTINLTVPKLLGRLRFRIERSEILSCTRNNLFALTIQNLQVSSVRLRS